MIGDQDQHLHSETMIVIEEIDTIPLGIAEASAIVADTTVSVDKKKFLKNKFIKIGFLNIDLFIKPNQ